MPQKLIPTSTGKDIAVNDLAREKAASDAMFLSIGEGAIVTDEHGRISRVNHIALSILGYEEDEILDCWYPGTIIAEDQDGNIIPNMERPITNVFLTGRPISARLYYRRKDKSKVIVYLNVSPVLLDGKPIGAIEVFRDITREVELERAKDEFISLASHQLRTPATAVKQYAGMLVQGYAGEMTEQQRRMAQNIYEANERQITIVNDLLRVAQVDAGKVKLKRAETDLAELVQLIIAEQMPKFEAHEQGIGFTTTGSPPLVILDPQLMRMVIENIVDNASKYTPEGKSIAVNLYSGKSYIALDIKDEGVGIARRDIPQIFHKFSRITNPLSDSAGGTGLGLYWAHKIVDLHGGTIKVRSRVGHGTTFTIRLPKAPKE